MQGLQDLAWCSGSGVHDAEAGSKRQASGQYDVCDVQQSQSADT